MTEESLDSSQTDSLHENASLEKVFAAKVLQAAAGLDSLLAARRVALKEKFGQHPKLEKMIAELHFAIEGLCDANAETRVLALSVLTTFHDTSDRKQLLPHFERLAWEDPDPGVRKVALAYFASAVRIHASASKKKQTGRKLAALVLDDSAVVDLRKAAYKGLCDLSSDREIWKQSFLDPAFPGDVDWTYVKSWSQF